MAIKLRLTRRGSKKRPYYWIVAADERAPRDGRYLEKLGTYSPMLPKDDEKRVTLVTDRVKYWLGTGATPTDRVAVFLGKAGLAEAPKFNNPQKAKPKAKAQERVREKEEKAAAAAEAAEQAKAEAQATPTPAAEEEATAAPASDAQEEATQEAPAAEEKTEEVKAEEVTETAAEASPAEEEKKDA